MISSVKLSEPVHDEEILILAQIEAGIHSVAGVILDGAPTSEGIMDPHTKGVDQIIIVTEECSETDDLTEGLLDTVRV